MSIPHLPRIERPILNETVNAKAAELLAIADRLAVDARRLNRAARRLVGPHPRYALSLLRTYGEAARSESAAAARIADELGFLATPALLRAQRESEERRRSRELREREGERAAWCPGGDHYAAAVTECEEAIAVLARALPALRATTASPTVARACCETWRKSCDVESALDAQRIKPAAPAASNVVPFGGGS
jgi:hypothetical protein